MKSKTITPKTSVRKAKELTERHQHSRGPKEAQRERAMGHRRGTAVPCLPTRGQRPGRRAAAATGAATAGGCAPNTARFLSYAGGEGGRQNPERRGTGPRRPAFWRSVLKDELTPPGGSRHRRKSGRGSIASAALKSFGRHGPEEVSLCLSCLGTVRERALMGRPIRQRKSPQRSSASGCHQGESWRIGRTSGRHMWRKLHLQEYRNDRQQEQQIQPEASY